MIRIPVLLGFDYQNPIGTMEVDETRLPPGANYHFALGYMIREMDHGVPTKIELLGVSAVPTDATV